MNTQSAHRVSEPSTLAVLQSIGIHSELLDQSEKEFLNENGYLPIHDVMSPAVVDQLRTTTQAEIDRIGSEANAEKGNAFRLFNLVELDPVFEICISTPKLLAAISHVLGEHFKLSSLNYRASTPGGGQQGLHADYGQSVEPGDYRVCNSIWLLDDFTTENGATRVVPGSHRSGKMPNDVMSDTMDSHPEQELLLAPAGSVVVFNSHTWHGGTLNQTDRPRRAMHSYFCRRDQTQQLNQRENLSPETVARLSPPLRHLLDVE